MPDPIVDQTELLRALVARLDASQGQTAALHAVVAGWQDELRKRDGAIAPAPAGAWQPATEINRAGSGSTRPGWLARVREVVSALVPPGATVAVFTRGEEQLLKLEGRRAWHYFQGKEGRFLDRSLADGAEAIAHAEGLKGAGARYLVFPETAFAWLEQRPKLKEHLEIRHRMVARLTDLAVVYRFSGRGPSWGNDLVPPVKQGPYRHLIRQIREVVTRLLPLDTVVAVVSKGDEELVQLQGRKGWHFPQDATGGYCGYHPGDCTEAIDHLEASRRQGADFLLIPGTMLWWLDHYPDFRRHLETVGTALFRQRHVGFIFDLGRAPAQAHPSGQG